jgi:hypothetical protein
MDTAHQDLFQDMVEFLKVYFLKQNKITGLTPPEN